MDEVTDTNIDKSKKEQELEAERVKQVVHYRNVMNYLGANVPIQVMCLPKDLENVLLGQGFLRVYDLIGHDLAEIKGVGPARRDILESRLSEFFAVHI